MQWSPLPSYRRYGGRFRRQGLRSLGSNLKGQRLRWTGLGGGTGRGPGPRGRFGGGPCPGAGDGAGTTGFRVWEPLGSRARLSRPLHARRY